MKKLIMIILAGTLAATSSLWAEAKGPAMDLVAMGTYFVPENDKIYDDGGGAELQLRLWMTDCIGLSLVGGWAQWNINEETAVYQRGGEITTAETGGSIDMYPVGASLLFRIFHNDRLSLIVEGGARYVILDEGNSDANITVTQPGRRVNREIFSNDRLKIDDGVVALAAAHLEFVITDNVFILAGGGYQWDLDKGDVKFLDQKIKDNKLEAALVQAGLGVRF